VSQPFICVVDANVALKLVFEQEHSDRADRLFRHLAETSGARFYVPDFFYAECASGLILYVRHQKYPAARARRDLADLEALALNVVPTLDLIKDALDLALTNGISGYDAVYVALSKRIGAPLVTADGGLTRALTGKPFQILHLANLEIPEI
jgi:predicted nucleic acid-binding protein